ncbi:hypothetical protein MRX96_017916 [Rhipicephalus microplus]
MNRLTTIVEARFHIQEAPFCRARHVQCAWKRAITAQRDEREEKKGKKKANHGPSTCDFADDRRQGRRRQPQRTKGSKASVSVGYIASSVSKALRQRQRAQCRHLPGCLLALLSRAGLVFPLFRASPGVVSSWAACDPQKRG